MAKAGNLKLDFMAKSIGITCTFYGLNTFLDVIEIPKPKKNFWLYGHFKFSDKMQFQKKSNSTTEGIEISLGVGDGGL